MTQRRATWTILAASLVVLAGLPAALALSAPPAEFAQGAAPVVDEGRGPNTPTVAARSARVSDLQVAQRDAPRSLRLDRLGIDAAVRAMGVEADGAMEVPADVADVGWYGFGPAPGARAGSAVLTAHVDGRDQGPGAFFRLSETRPGDVVEVATEAGATLRYTVVERQRYAKDALPTARLFRRDGRPLLVLVTCGGAFDETARRYEENVVVIAEPIIE